MSADERRPQQIAGANQGKQGFRDSFFDMRYSREARGKLTKGEPAPSYDGLALVVTVLVLDTDNRRF